MSESIARKSRDLQRREADPESILGEGTEFKVDGVLMFSRKLLPLQVLHNCPKNPVKIGFLVISALFGVRALCG